MKLLTNTPEDVALIRRICSILDYSAALVTNATSEDVRKACADARQYKYAAVPVFPSYLPLVAKELEGTGVAPQLALGFPCGGVSTKVKAYEAAQGIEDGAKEIDMVLNLGRLADKDYKYVENDIKAVVAVAKAAGISVKAIIEIGFWNDAQKRDAVEIAIASGVDFIKTCTGFAEGRATVHDIALIKECAKGRVKIKASGGVLSLEDAAAFVETGADRVAGRTLITNQMRGLGIEGF